MSEAHFKMGIRSARRVDPETNQTIMKPPQEVFIEWLTGEAELGDTQSALAERLGVSKGTLSNWKKDPEFVKAWERRLREKGAHPERQQGLLDKLYERGLAGDVKSTELYFKLIDRMTPNKVEIDDKRELADLSAAELEDLASNVSHLRSS